MWKICILFLVCTLQLSFEKGEKSKQKCKEYAASVYQMEDSPVMTRRAKKNRVSTCGMVEVPLVIGGTKASPREFPHMTVIGYGKSPNDPNLKWMCGGTLISNLYIMTAAHCINDGIANAVKVRLGEIDFNDETESIIQDRNIAKKIKHPKYNGGKYDDLALILMEIPVQFTAFVRPACLQTSKETPDVLIATGFGKTAYDAPDGSKTLMKVDLDIVPRDKCAKYFSSEIKRGIMSDGVTASITCAGHLLGGKDTCQGDSGGPLQMALSEPYCMYSIVGVVSFGKFCGFANSPAIYTTVYEYLDWIENIVWP